jgi:hypothetical protein
VAAPPAPATPVPAAPSLVTSAAPKTTVPVHLTINFPKASVVSAEFGSLPKDVVVAEISACNDTQSAMTISQSRIIQSLRAQGFQALSRSAAIALIGSSQAQSKAYLVAKYSQIALNIVTGLVVSKSVSLGPALGSSLPGVEGIMQVVVPQLQSAVSDHAYLSFDSNGLPAAMQLGPVECAVGTALMSTPPANAVVDFTVSIPVPASAK